MPAARGIEAGVDAGFPRSGSATSARRRGSESCKPTDVFPGGRLCPDRGGAGAHENNRLRAFPGVSAGLAHGTYIASQAGGAASRPHGTMGAPTGVVPSVDGPLSTTAEDPRAKPSVV